ncbi:MAG: tetratricopeptide repeat protein [Terriglobales bacterium]
MADAPPASPRVCFSVFEVDLRSGELHRNGSRVKLQELPFKILALLLEHPGEVVTREELQQKLWLADTFVDFEHGLNTAIMKLRTALGDDAHSPRFVETVGHRGYRFIAPVTRNGAGVGSVTVAGGPGEEAAAEGPPAADATQAGRRLLLPSLAVTTLLVALLGFNVGGIRDRVWPKGPAPPIRAIAVLPLENLSGDPNQDYFADGMTDALITDLAKIGSLRVISRTSVMRYKGTTTPTSQIARDLNVQAIVEGSVVRSGERVRITAQLIHAATDQHLWAESYERDVRDILGLQAEVARAIAAEIQVKLTPQEEARLRPARPVNPEAHEAYLRGRYYLEKVGEDESRRAIEHLQQALQADPNYAPAYAGLAVAYYRLSNYFLPPKEAMPKARAAAIKALEIDNTLAEAHTSLALVKEFYDWDWAGAESAFKRAIELNPSYAFAHSGYGGYLSRMGRHQEALAEYRRSWELNPLSLYGGIFVGSMYYESRQYDRAVEQYRKTLEMDPNFFPAHWGLASAYEAKGMYKEAIAEYEKALSLGGPPEVLAWLGHAHARAGNRKEALKILDEMKGPSKRKFVSAYDLAVIHTGLGEKDQALAWLEKAYEQRAEALIDLNADPRLDPLRSDSRFKDLTHRVGLPQ